MIIQTENQKLKCLLANELKLGEELIEFIYECVGEIFNDDVDIAQKHFRDSLEYYPHNGCLCSIYGIKKEVEDCKKRRLEWENKRKMGDS